MATNAGGVYVDLGLNSARFTEGLRAGGVELNKFGTNADKVGKNMSVSFTQMGRGAAGFATGLATVTGVATILGGLSLVGIVEQLRTVTEQFAAIADVADRTGLGTEQVQELQYATEMAGGSVEDFNGGVQRFAKGMSDAARGSGDLDKVLRLNGISLTDVKGKMRPTLDVFYDYADLIKNAKNPQDALNFATMAFGRSAGPGMVVALRQGAAGLREAAKEGRAFGAIADAALIAKAAEIDDAFVRLARVIKVQAGGALVEGADAVRQYQNAIIGMAAAMGAVGAGVVLGPLVASLAAATAGAATAAVRMSALNVTILAVASAQRVAALATAGLSVALNLLGGPVGIGIAAVAGTIAYLALRSDDAKVSAERHAQALKELDGVITQVRDGVPGATQRLKELGDEHVANAKKALADAQAELEYAKAVANAPRLSGWAGRHNVKPPQDNSKELGTEVERRVADLAAKQAKLQELETKITAGLNPSKDPPSRTPNPDAEAREKQLQRILEQSRQQTEQLNLERTLLGQTTYEIDRQRTAQDLLNSVKQADIAITPELRKQVEDLADAHARATVSLEQASASQMRWNDLQQQVGDYMVDGVTSLASGYRDLNDVLKDGINLIAQMVLKAALLGQGPLAGLFGAPATGGGVGGLLGSVISGFRADGGPVGGGKSYVVGERGPEVFTPNRSGFITPNTNMPPAAARATFAPVTHIDARGSQMTEAQLNAILADHDRKLMAKMPGIAMQSVMDGRRNVQGLR